MENKQLEGIPLHVFKQIFYKTVSIQDFRIIANLLFSSKFR